MDEGVIYEDGTPQQIFDNPQKEKTRRFIHHLKVFEEKITSRDFDFISVVNRMQSFIEKNQISQKSYRNLHLVFEELLMQALIVNLSDSFEVSFVLEYEEQTGSTVLRLDYSGQSFNPISYCDEISKNLVENAVSSYEHDFSDDMNSVKVKIA